MNLINAWQDVNADGGVFVRSAAELRSVAAQSTDRLLGLFAPADLAFEDKRDPQVDPSLSEMAETAFRVLRRNSNGFVLVVMSGRINSAHISTQANRALSETLALEDAFEALTELMSETEMEETLLIVTADHSNTMTLAGYPPRGNNIIGGTKN